MILLLDNYDSFVHNVARSFRELGALVDVVRSDRITVDEALARRPSHVVISPGPCTPAEAGISVELVRRAEGRVPVLGICLGHQVVAAAYGGAVIRSREPVHGRATPIFHREEGILAPLSSPFRAGRYHSLEVDRATLPACLAATAWTDDGCVMALRHRFAPVWGVQFHPESVLTQSGHDLLASFLSLAAPVAATSGAGTQGAPFAAAPR